MQTVNKISDGEWGGGGGSQRGGGGGGGDETASTVFEAKMVF